MHLAAHDGEVEGLLQHQEREDGDRQAEEEAPSPAEAGGVDDQAADQRAADRGEGERRADVAGVPAALPRAHHRGDHDLDQRGQAADAETLDGAGADQHLHARREAGDQRADAVDHQRRLNEQLLAEQVGELAPDRGAGGHRQQGRDDHPGVAGLAAVEVGHDPGQGVGDDRAREHGHEHREEQAAERLQDLAVGHLAGLLGGDGRLGHCVPLVREKVDEGNHIPGPDRRSQSPDSIIRNGSDPQASPVGTCPRGRLRWTWLPDHLRVGWLPGIRQQPQLLAGSHLTRPIRIHSSDHLLSRVAPPYVAGPTLLKGFRAQGIQGASLEVVQPRPARRL